MFMERKNTMKMSVFQKLIYKVNKMSTTSKLLELCEDSVVLISELIRMTNKGRSTTRTILRKNKRERLFFQFFRIDYETIVMNSEHDHYEWVFGIANIVCKITEESRGWSIGKAGEK